jgi:phosphoenolpyruvate-protein kinase (PTS system EI component)
MGEQVLQGTPASPGVGLGLAWRLFDAIEAGASVPHERREQEHETAVAALAAAADALIALAAGLSTEEAEIVETGALMAQDPGLIAAVGEAVVADGLTAAEAIIRATGEHADAIAAIGDETLAARADDVRSLGRRAAALASGRAQTAPRGSDLILIAADLGPADVAELAPSLAGVALAGGGATAHAAIVARSLGVPMVTGLYDRVLEIAEGARVVIDGSSGILVSEPGEERARAAKTEMGVRQATAQRAHELREQPAVTSDGKRITVLANVASPEELDLGLRTGAEGIGLLRTELAFLDATEWPNEQEHAAALKPILAGLGPRPAIVRVLDFGVDKSPPFLHDVVERGIELLQAHPDAFVAQLGEMVRASRDHDIRILLPMVDRPEQVTQSRVLLERVAAQLGVDRIPQLGSMIETPSAARNAPAIAERSDFLSIGTNDLTASTLGLNRFAANTARAHHPLVLRSIAASVRAAHDADISIEVCGEAASDPIMLPLLVGLGIDEISVGAARVGTVREWIRQLDADETAGLARSALTMDAAEEVEWAVRPLAVEHALTTR